MNGVQTELIARAKAGDRAASEQLVVENAGLIWSIARRFYGRGVESDDLYQLGCVGFLKAIDGFDMSFGTQFSTYAVPKIAGEIRRFLRDDGSIKVSRSIKEQATAIKLRGKSSRGCTAENRSYRSCQRKPDFPPKKLPRRKPPPPPRNPSTARPARTGLPWKMC